MPRSKPALPPPSGLWDVDPVSDDKRGVESDTELTDQSNVLG